MEYLLKLRIYGLYTLLLAICFIFCVLQAQVTPKRIVVLGFDGVEPTLVHKWMKEGKLPNLSLVAAQGSFMELATSNPAQSPVAWTTFATGKNPGKHNIFGFLKRGDNDYHPRLALVGVEKRPVLGGTSGKIGLALVFGIFVGGFYIVWRHLRHKRKRRDKFISIAISLIVSCAFFYTCHTYLPSSIPWPVTLKRASSVWTIAGEHHVKTVVLGAPLAFPAEKVSGGRLLCGLGVSDMAGTNGLWFRYSTLFYRVTSTETGGWQIPLEGADPKWQGMLFGPRNLMADEERERLKKQLTEASTERHRDIQNRLANLQKQAYLTMPFSVQRQGLQLLLDLNGQRQSLSQNQWSDWFTVAFSLTPLIHFRGMVRVHVLSVDPPEIYITPVQFHPRHLPLNVDISYPSNFAADLVDDHGLYPTLGWPEATNPLKDEQISEMAFWDDLKYVMAKQQQILFSEFDRGDWQLLIAIFYVTDRASHMYFRFIDPLHARHSDIQQMPQHADNLLRVYQWMDEVVGRIHRAIEPGDVLFVLSDHGFAPFRWGVNLNTWLYENGYLALKSDINNRTSAQIIDLYENEKLCQQIDWSRTRAYSIGLGKIFINLKGRDPQGIVSSEDYQSLCRELRDKLLQLQHRGEKAIAQVDLRDEIYHGPYVHESADIIIGFHRGYRISWQSTLGGIATEIFEPNLLKWSGDHCSVAPPLIPGVLFCNHRLHKANAHLQDLAPTILSLFGIEHGDMEGQPLLK